MISAISNFFGLLRYFWKSEKRAVARVSRFYLFILLVLILFPIDIFGLLETPFSHVIFPWPLWHFNPQDYFFTIIGNHLWFAAFLSIPYAALEVYRRIWELKPLRIRSR